MPTQGQLEKAKKILERQLPKIGAQMGNEAVKGSVTKAITALMSDIQSDNMASITDSMASLYHEQLTTENSRTQDAKANVEKAILLIEGEIAAVGSE